MHALRNSVAADGPRRLPPAGPAHEAPEGEAGAPLFFGEEALQQPAPGAPPPGQAPGLLGEMLRARSPGERHGVVQGALQALGFDWLAWGRVVLRRGVPVPTRFFTSHAHPGWTGCYFRERHWEVDWRHADAAASRLPLPWTVEQLGARAQVLGTRRPARFAEQLAGCGLRAGLWLSLPSASVPQERSVLSLASASAAPAVPDDERLGRVLLFALGLHEFLSLHMPPPGAAPAAGLSQVQQKVLRALSQGLGDKAIAQRLQLSTHTVDYHMRQLRRHFGVRNRVQLVHAARGSLDA